MNSISISAKLSYLRQRDHLTAEQISQHTDVPLSTLNKLLAGITKNPSIYTMARLAKLFDVPISYFLEEDLPADCNVRMYAASRAVFCASKREMHIIEQFRALPANDQNAVASLINEMYLKLTTQPSSGNEQILLCYSSAANGKRGCVPHALNFYHISAALSPALSDADYAIQVINPSLEPIYPPGTLLAVRAIAAKHNQLGVFIYNNEGYVRRYYEKGSVRKLIAPSRDIPIIDVAETDSLRCVGTVLGAIRTYRRL